MFACHKDMHLAEVVSTTNQILAIITSSRDQIWDNIVIFNLKTTNSAYLQHVSLSTTQLGVITRDLHDIKSLS